MIWSALPAENNDVDDSNELLDELLQDCKRLEDLLGDAGQELKVRLTEQMLGAELTMHLGHEAGAEPPLEQANLSNGTPTKRVKGSDGEVPLAAPRDRKGSLEPELVSASPADGPKTPASMSALHMTGHLPPPIPRRLEDLPVGDVHESQVFGAFAAGLTVKARSAPATAGCIVAAH